MSMHSDHHPHGFANDFDGAVWPAIWVAVAMAGLAAFAWMSS